MTKRISHDLESRLDRALAAPKPVKQPFQPGQYVEFFSPACPGYYVEPFRADDVMEVQALSKVGRGKKISWRVRVFAVNRNASGWVDAEVLQIYGGTS